MSFFSVQNVHYMNMWKECIFSVMMMMMMKFISNANIPAKKLIFMLINQRVSFVLFVCLFWLFSTTLIWFPLYFFVYLCLSVVMVMLYIKKRKEKLNAATQYKIYRTEKKRKKRNVKKNTQKNRIYLPKKKK